MESVQGHRQAPAARPRPPPARRALLIRDGEQLAVKPATWILTPVRIGGGSIPYSDASSTMSVNHHFSHLGLARWPFTVVPDPAACDYLADRAQLRADIDQLLSGLRRHDTSSIHIFWAWFGAGKTHTLYYIRNQIQSFSQDSGITSIYTEFPRAPRGFLDVYRAFSGAVDTRLLSSAYLEIATSPLADKIGFFPFSGG